MSRLSSFESDLTVAIVGPTGGIGGALLKMLGSDERISKIYALGRSSPTELPLSAEFVELDLEDEASIADAASQIAPSKPLDLVIVATGLLHTGHGLGPEKRLEDLNAEYLQGIFAVNTIGPALVARYFLPLLAKQRRSMFAVLSARVGSIGDNRLGGWYGYRASKAALNMLIRGMAIEMERRSPGCVVVGLHPGTVDTELSAPFQRNVPQQQLFSADTSAGYLLDVLNRATNDDSGRVLAWDGSVIPY